MSTIELYDTTLRDGAQTWGITFSLDDKLRIAQKLDELGIDVIEGGYPGSNPKDRRFFRMAKDIPFKHARVAAFGSTCRPDLSPEKDPQIASLIETGTEVVTIVGKSWELHVREILAVPLKRNLEMISDSLAYLRPHCRRLVFDAEHFFDGFKKNPEFAVNTLLVAQSAGADVLVLCDTNGGTLPSEIVRIINEVKPALTAALGIHAHNDSETAVANSLMALEAGATHVQGTINGIGERCGNANLISIIPALALKAKTLDIPADRLRLLKHVSEFVDEMANRTPVKSQPYVGASAFAHKGGLHTSAVVKNTAAYEHMDPQFVGNSRIFPMSEQAGRAALVLKAQEYGISLKPDDPRVTEILKTIKDFEARGAHYDVADGSFQLLMKRMLGRHKKFFTLHGFHVNNIKRQGDTKTYSDAIIRIVVGDKMEFSAADGNGPVNALDSAFRKALQAFYPNVSQVRLTDFKVRVLEGSSGTGAIVRVLIESTDGEEVWWTVGFNENVIQASWDALVDSIDYKLQKDLVSQT
ncbi:MAG TPA: citramalate synthase [Desulfomonilaceae bacterium]|nr:citramalate synthase [Desulfomonilaceae bacterium]